MKALDLLPSEEGKGADIEASLDQYESINNSKEGDEEIAIKQSSLES